MALQDIFGHQITNVMQSLELLLYDFCFVPLLTMGRPYLLTQEEKEEHPLHLSCLQLSYSRSVWKFKQEHPLLHSTVRKSMSKSSNINKEPFLGQSMNNKSQRHEL